tara:strand:+ start:267 stop:542 length:276 start_codon:yes stop_codon:yes gene_type:complete
MDKFGLDWPATCARLLFPRNGFQGTFLNGCGLEKDCGDLLILNHQNPALLTPSMKQDIEDALTAFFGRNMRIEVVAIRTDPMSVLSYLERI